MHQKMPTAKCQPFRDGLSMLIMIVRLIWAATCMPKDWKCLFRLHNGKYYTASLTLLVPNHNMPCELTQCHGCLWLASLQRQITTDDGTGYYIYIYMYIYIYTGYSIYIYISGWGGNLSNCILSESSMIDVLFVYLRRWIRTTIFNLLVVLFSGQ